MSVMTCNRGNCKNIMCDKYNHKYGYICNDCLEELKNRPFIDIKEFMDSDKPDIPPSPQPNWLDIINQIFQ